ncbi:MAG: ABC transporter permease [Bacillota bacterium]|nr:ABC transporter permease [Bacillota bacterium]
MKRKSANITNNIYPGLMILAILILWECLSIFEIVPSFMLPTPQDTVMAFIDDFPLLMSHMKVTLIETLVGTVTGICIGFLSACLMDRWDAAYKAMYPLIVITQTIPAVAIAPLLVLWFGYQMMPKVVLIVLITFFPIVIGVLDGFRSADKDAINLLRAMGASRWQIFRHIKFPSALPNFFSGLRITVAYAVVGAVLAEWLGGFAGLGVYMTRVKKSFAYDKMFAVIFLISIISLLLIWLVNVLQKKCMPWDNIEDSSNTQK